MKRFFYLVVAILISTISFSQTTDKDLTDEQILKTLCDNKFFEKCQTPVEFKYDKKTLEDSLTNYLTESNSQLQTGKAIFQFILAKDSMVYSVKQIAGNMVGDSSIIKALRQTAGLWTVGKQNSYLICSYVRLEVEFIDDKVRVNILRSY